MKKETENKLRRLTSNQASALKTFITKPMATSGATGYSGQSLGGTVSALTRTGFIEPLGREGRQFRWELSDPDLKISLKQNKEEILVLLNRVSRG
jgi:hypothetical protein